MNELIRPDRNRAVQVAGNLPDNWKMERSDHALENSPFYKDLKWSLRRGVLFVVVPFLLMIAGLTLFPIPGAVISSGYLTSESAAKKIQSPETAVVTAILVRDGDHVKTGQPLVQLDDTTAKAELAIISESIEQLSAQNARLSAEALELDAVQFPSELTQRADDPQIAAMIKGESELFRLRSDTFKSQMSQMSEQANQINEQVGGVNGQIEAANRQHDLMFEQLQGFRSLLKKQLVSGSQVSSLEQQIASLEGQRAQFLASIPLAKARQAELKSQIAELSGKRMSEAAAEQRDVQAKQSEASQKKLAAERRLQQLLLTAPQDGVVTNLKVRTVGGVVTPSEEVMTIVPASDALIAEVKITPQDASRVYINQAAELHFSAIGGSNAPQFSGEVTYLAPDVTFDARTGVAYFVARISLKEPLNDPARNLKAPLGSGTPVEVFLLREAQPIFDYIARPIIQQAQRAFR